MTIGEEITQKITETLHDSMVRGERIVPCTALWNSVGKNHSIADAFYGRYKSVLRELIHNATIKMHMDEEGRPKGFELLKRKH